MVCRCKGFCRKFEGILRTPGGVGGAKKNYSHGWKRCKRCSYNINTTNLRCECCRGLLKTRSMKHKINPLRINDNRPLYKYNYQELANYVWRIV